MSRRLLPATTVLALLPLGAALPMLSSFPLSDSGWTFSDDLTSAGLGFQNTHDDQFGIGHLEQLAFFIRVDDPFLGQVEDYVFMQTSGTASGTSAQLVFEEDIDADSSPDIRLTFDYSYAVTYPSHLRIEGETTVAVTAENIAGSARTLHLYSYNDFDLDIIATDDAVHAAGPARMEWRSPYSGHPAYEVAIGEFESGTAPTSWEANGGPDLAAGLAGFPSIGPLADADTSSPGEDMDGAFHWGVELLSAATFSTTVISRVTLIPEPSRASMLLLAAAACALRRRRPAPGDPDR